MYQSWKKLQLTYFILIFIHLGRREGERHCIEAERWAFEPSSEAETVPLLARITIYVCCKISRNLFYLLSLSLPEMTLYPILFHHVWIHNSNISSAGILQPGKHTINQLPLHVMQSADNKLFICRTSLPLASTRWDGLSKLLNFLHCSLFYQQCTAFDKSRQHQEVLGRWVWSENATSVLCSPPTKSTLCPLWPS